MTSAAPSVIIVGAGLSGLACARLLAKAGVAFSIYDAADDVGGRVRSDKLEGFILDRGFQTFLPAYPEARKVLDYDALRLQPLMRGADVFCTDRFHRVIDPFNHPLEAMRNVWDGFIPWLDKWRVLHLRKEVFGLRSVPRGPDMEAEDYLRDFGISDACMERFFRPFFGGVFLEKDLRTSARVMLFLFAMFDRGGSAIPAYGMQAIPDQLAISLPPGSLHLNSPVASVREGAVTLPDGRVVEAAHVVLAVNEQAAARLLPQAVPQVPLPGRCTTCLYFTTDQPLPRTPILYLDGEGRGPVNHACVLTAVSPHLAPPGQHLISTSIVGCPGSEELETVVREQMARWFGPAALAWRHLRSYRIQEAQPEARQLHPGAAALPAQIGPGLYRCGDWCQDVSINGALLSGRRAAEAVLGALACGV